MMMRKFNSSQKYKASIGFVDLLFNLLIGFVFLFVVAFLLINPVVKKKIVDPKTEFMITMEWPDKDSNDIDIWVKRDDGPDHVWFNSKDNGYMHIDRDDLGQNNDEVMVDGKLVKTFLNREVVAFRQKVKGKYVVNIHWYSKKGDTPLEIVPVKLELISISPYQVLGVFELSLEREGAEATAFQFTIDEEGNVIDISRDQERWIQSHVNTVRNGRDGSLAPPGSGIRQ